MKIAILATEPTLYSHIRLVEAGEKRGHKMRVINPLHCYISINAQKPEIHYRGGELIHGYDAIIPRIGASITFYGTAVLRQFEMQGVFPLNESIAITRARDKLRSLQLLSRRKVNMPVTGFTHSTQDTKALIEMVGGAPLIVKLIEGTQGIGVVLCETDQAAQSVISAFRGLNANILVQEFIKESRGTDIRCFVVGGEVVASMQRTAKEGEFRANIHQGGTGQAIEVTPEERAMALKATKIMGLNVAGVDIMRSNRGPMVLEINSSPGLEGIETSTGKDIAGDIIEFLEKNAKPGKTKTKGKG